ncbi:MAG: WYL domain-containing protein, partial [Bacteroidota bacterium]
MIESCSDALYEYEGIRKGVSRRTVQMDIQVMRSDKLGYNAPIIVIDKKFYTYADPSYSITNIPITDQDLNKMSEVVEILKQFKGFQHFTELSGIVQKLEDKIQSNKGDHRPIIDLEKNPLLRGLENIDIIYDAIAKKKQLEITYQSFKARKANRFNFHPMLLKEHRNRWFVLGQRKDDSFVLLALDRMLDIEKSLFDVKPYNVEKVLHFFDNVIGVTVNENQTPQTIRLWVMRMHAPYVLTKPLHSSQRMVDQDSYGIIIEIDVVPNFELEKEILSFGDGMRVLSPNSLKRMVKSRLKGAIEGYQTDVHSEKLYHIMGQLNAKGYVEIEKLFKQKVLQDIGRAIRKTQKTNQLHPIDEGLF